MNYVTNQNQEETPADANSGAVKYYWYSTAFQDDPSSFSSS